MNRNEATDCGDFYRSRDLRTEKYIEGAWRPSRIVRIATDAASTRTEVGQHLLLSLTNLLARVHRHIIFTLPDEPIPLATFSIAEGETLQSAVLGAARMIDPCGSFELADVGGEIKLGIGEEAEPGLDWYLGADHALAYLDREPVILETSVRGSMRGAGLAACLGAAAAFKEELNLPAVPRKVSAWNYVEGAEGARGPIELPPLNVGRVLVVGAGAVASGLVYWLRSWGVEGEWAVVDRDTVKLHNTNRSMLFVPGDAGWPPGEERPKANLIARLLPRGRSIRKWYKEAKEVHDERFDVILALANDYGVREHLAHRNATVLLHATTGRNWLSQLHRHVAGYDDCVVCRLGEVKEVAFACSTAEVATGNEERIDAALPFLSAASGLMLATLLQRLQAGVLMASSANNWRWDFLSEHRMSAPPGRSWCRDGCASWYSPSVRAKTNAGTAWAHLEAAAG